MTLYSIFMQDQVEAILAGIKHCRRHALVLYWHDMTNDIKEHIRTCDTCQRTNKKLSKASAELHPIPVRSEVWHQVEIDLVGPLTLTRNNNR